ncbi:flagellar motor switch protein FliN/FliY [Methylomagnum ishizawai]|uniref:Flagellar motor switch protein FliN n=2 Tax=Methylomagnum ishizawai TaxID=1760988 RepID=A0A1Y6D9Y3_9GAMM|nr:flagellar motor switch protein FliN/FliY [Methylomagnum ishizawai]
MSENDLGLDDPLEGAGDGAGDNFADDWAAAMQEQQALADRIASAPKIAQPMRAEFDDLVPPPTVEAKSEDVNLDVLLDVPVTIAMEIGRTRINIRNLLQLTQGSVVELDRLAGEPMDVMVNGTLIAHGEVVVVNDKFGIRLTDVVSPAERVKKLR